MIFLCLLATRRSYEGEHRPREEKHDVFDVSEDFSDLRA